MLEGDEMMSSSGGSCSAAKGNNSEARAACARACCWCAGGWIALSRMRTQQLPVVALGIFLFSGINFAIGFSMMGEQGAKTKVLRANAFYYW